MKAGNPRNPFRSLRFDGVPLLLATGLGLILAAALLSLGAPMALAAPASQFGRVAQSTGSGRATQSAPAEEVPCTTENRAFHRAIGPHAHLAPETLAYDRGSKPVLPDPLSVQDDGESDKRSGRAF